MPPASDNAMDGMTLIEVIRTLEEAGYTGQLAAGDEGTVRCLTCRETSKAVEVHVDRICRTEGLSDPADMVAVVAVRCPRCATKGTLALKYGPGATSDEAEVLAQLDDIDREKVQSSTDGL